MSQSQNATDHAISGQSEENWDFVASAKRASARSVNGKTLTRERAELKQQALIDLCKADYRMHFAAIYGKTDRLPSVVFEKITEAVETVIRERLEEITPSNVVSYRRAFAFKAKDLSFVDRITLTGENTLTLKEQKLACSIAIGVQQKRLEELEKKPTPDYDREKAVKTMLLKLEVAKNFIDGEIAHQDKLAEETKA